MVVDTRHKWDVLISYSWMDVIPTHNGRFYWRPARVVFELFAMYHVPIEATTTHFVDSAIKVKFDHRII